MTTATSRPVRALKPSLKPARRAVGILGQERGPTLGHVGKVDTGVGAHEPVPRLGHDEVTSAPQDADRLGLGQETLGVRVRGVDADHAALRLGHDLLGDHDHVARDERRLRGDDRGQVVPRAYLTDALDAEDQQ